jgi:hypothetical protein
MRGLVSVMALALVACSPNPAQKSAEPAAPPAAEAPRTELATVATPLPGDWYFEAVFAASLVGADGKVIAEAPARAQTDWTAPGPKVFVAELPFTVTADTPATLILQEDMPPEDAPPREVRIQVVLTPG